ncbi:uncharacterized protein C8Q71DRAFT_241979 [Rhodofomes roseus]|uniref:Secreted protein n=1 Tax=Rhodofomes roseus TaxID=34475 RepID=A0ABQ8K6S5_9APHY|nr:uncharacterized protein C8Q71DRAFT_241979 [Rhodofomes roseus]KAH9832863.1 hypothetical protein C8Q71DRAFT_241979 [Rhodofomes roseus]
MSHHCPWNHCSGHIRLHMWLAVLMLGCSHRGDLGRPLPPRCRLGVDARRYPRQVRSSYQLAQILIISPLPHVNLGRVLQHPHAEGTAKRPRASYDPYLRCDLAVWRRATIAEALM